MEELFAVLHHCFDIAEDAEITIEANPGTLTMEKLEIYRQSGINRLSLGLQSADDQELNYLGRIHTYEDFLKSYQRAREAGFTNINVDLMSALPGQDLHSWKTTLRKVLMLKPEHISAYSLIIEEGTPFYCRYGEGENHGSCSQWDSQTIWTGRGLKGRPMSLWALPDLPDEEMDREMYHVTKELMAAHGYHRYEISNYARSGCECLHNKGYWTGTEYLGLGLGASSYTFFTAITIQRIWRNTFLWICRRSGQLPGIFRKSVWRSGWRSSCFWGCVSWKACPEQSFSPVLVRICGMFTEL